MQEIIAYILIILAIAITIYKLWQRTVMHHHTTCQRDAETTDGDDDKCKHCDCIDCDLRK